MQDHITKQKQTNGMPVAAAAELYEELKKFCLKNHFSHNDNVMHKIHSHLLHARIVNIN